MYLKNLSLIGFRNYLSESFDFHPMMNFIYGRNAQGKTNVLEAIHILTTPRSFRTTQNLECVFWGRKEAILHGTFIHDNIAKNLSIFFQNSGKKVQINGKSAKSCEYLPLTAVVSFAPTDLLFFQLGPHVRRQYIDRALGNLDCVYLKQLTQYNRTLFQRNAAIRFDNRDLVDLWGIKLHEIGAKILLKRLLFIEKLNKLTSCLYREISGVDVSLYTEYKTGFSIKVGEEELYLSLIEKQREMLDEERKFKRSLVGPHRDDLNVLIQGRQVRLYGSQGEQRTAVLALKLAESIIIEQENGVPIFLLDDITSELDENRRNCLLSFIKRKKAQVFMTSVELKDTWIDKEKSACFYIEEGRKSVRLWENN